MSAPKLPVMVDAFAELREQFPDREMTEADAREGASFVARLERLGSALGDERNFERWAGRVLSSRTLAKPLAEVLRKAFKDGKRAGRRAERESIAKWADAYGLGAAIRDGEHTKEVDE